MLPSSWFPSHSVGLAGEMWYVNIGLFVCRLSLFIYVLLIWPLPKASIMPPCLYRVNRFIWKSAMCSRHWFFFLWAGTLLHLSALHFLCLVLPFSEIVLGSSKLFTTMVTNLLIWIPFWHLWIFLPDLHLPYTIKRHKVWVPGNLVAWMIQRMFLILCG